MIIMSHIRKIKIWDVTVLTNGKIIEHPHFSFGAGMPWNEIARIKLPLKSKVSDMRKAVKKRYAGKNYEIVDFEVY